MTKTIKKRGRGRPRKERKPVPGRPAHVSTLNTSCSVSVRYRDRLVFLELCERERRSRVDQFAVMLAAYCELRGLNPLTLAAKEVIGGDHGTNQEVAEKADRVK